MSRERRNYTPEFIGARGTAYSVARAPQGFGGPNAELDMRQTGVLECRIQLKGLSAAS